MSGRKEETPRQRLLARQVSLLRHLTDPYAFEASPAAPEFAAMDEERLRLVGRMSFDKRMSKIRTALPRTFSFVPHVEGMSEAEFARRRPPFTNLRQENARQFVDYLREVWRERAPMEPAFLPDLAAVEAAVVRVNAVVADPRTDRPVPGTAPAFRRARDVELLRCGYDVQPFFATGEGRRPPVGRDVRLVIASSRRQKPRICEVGAGVFDFLGASAGWRPLDAPEFAADPGIPDLLRTLSRMEIIEVNQ